MKKTHHSLTMVTTADLLKFWKESGRQPAIPKLDEMFGLMGSPSQVRSSWLINGFQKGGRK